MKKKIKIKGVISGSEYDFNYISKNDFLNDKFKTIQENRFTLFMLINLDSLQKINKVIAIGNTVGKTALLDTCKDFDFTHIFYINDRPMYEKHGVNEELVLMFNPNQILFLSEKSKLSYVLTLLNSSTSL